MDRGGDRYFMVGILGKFNYYRIGNIGKQCLLVIYVEDMQEKVGYYCRIKNSF